MKKKFKLLACVLLCTFTILTVLNVKADSGWDSSYDSGGSSWSSSSSSWGSSNSGSSSSSSHGYSSNGSESDDIIVIMMIVFILFPIIGAILGNKYEKWLDKVTSKHYH